MLCLVYDLYHILLGLSRLLLLTLQKKVKGLLCSIKKSLVENYKTFNYGFSM